MLQTTTISHFKPSPLKLLKLQNSYHHITIAINFTFGMAADQKFRIRGGAPDEVIST